MMTNTYVLVDSSVWIDFFRSESSILDKLIEEDMVCINELILTELLPALEIIGQKEAIKSLESLPSIDLKVSWPLIRKYQVLNLKNGINKVGIPDLLILQQVIENKLTLFSRDKHFRLMQKYLHFELIME